MQIALRYGRGDVDRMRANAAELVGLVPDAIIASGAWQQQILFHGEFRMIIGRGVHPKKVARLTQCAHQ